MRFAYFVLVFVTSHTFNFPNEFVSGTATAEIGLELTGRKNDVLCVSNNRELDEVLRRRSQKEYNDHSVHITHAEPAPDLWLLLQERIPATTYEMAKNNQVPVSVGCFAGLFRKKPKIPVVTVVDDLVPIHLSDAIYKTARTGVYGIAELPQAVIKYYEWCRGSHEPNDSIVTEAFFMEKLSPLGLAPKVYYYSDYLGFTSGSGNPIPPPVGITGDSGKLIAAKEGRCTAPVLRYMIMERLGMSVANYAESSQRPILNAMKLGAQMVSLLKSLHSHDIVHGDAHWGNFVFKCDDVKNLQCGELVMIDFGRSKLITSENTFPQHIRNTNVFASKWEMMGFPSVYRDDVYRAVQNSAMAMYNGKLCDYIKGLTPSDFFTMKQSANFFEIYDGNRFINQMGLQHLGLHQEERMRIRPLLYSISDEASQSRTITLNGYVYRQDEDRPWLSKPNYDLIINAYREIIFIIDPRLRAVYDPLPDNRKDEIFRIKRT